jgi:hypothetical protein
MRRISWFSVALVLPLLGWVSLLPLLLVFPIYSDELLWKLINSRLLLDSGKLIYLFPGCSKGLSLAPPISWYPVQLTDAILYSDMTNPQVLRYGGVLGFIAIIVYCAWFVRFNLRLEIGRLSTVGAVLAPMSLGVLPFLLVLNRPEQALVLVLVCGCTIPAIVRDRKLTILQTWMISALFILLCWLAVSTHIKAIFVLPALLTAAFLALRQWLPSLTILAAACFGAIETFRLWSIRTDCPESPFLMQVFRNQSLSASDLSDGAVHLLRLVWQNVLNMNTYWDNAGFQKNYQGQWLPSADAPQTLIDRILNAAIPVFIGIGAAFVIAAFASSTARAVKTRKVPDSGPLIGMSLLACLVSISAFQSGKNFYETALILPLFTIAVMSALTTTTLPIATLFGGRKVIVLLAIFAFSNQLIIAYRYYPKFSAWQLALEARQPKQDAVRRLIDRCGIEADTRTKHLLVDEFTYTLLWRTQEPYFLGLVDGWWGTGLDQARIIHERNIIGAVGACPLVSTKIWSSIISEAGFCCAKSS